MDLSKFHLTGDFLAVALFTGIAWYCRREIVKFDKHISECADLKIVDAERQTRVEVQIQSMQEQVSKTDEKIDKLDSKLDRLLERNL